MKSDPLVSIVIPNWNGKAFLEECLESLRVQTFQDFEPILVENGSSDGSADFIKERYGDFVRLIENPKNLGVAGGNNIGIRSSKGKYIILLNNDTAAEPNWLEELVKAAQIRDYGRVGMWASKIYSYYHRDRIEAVGELIYRDGLNRARGQYEKDEGQYEKIEEIFFAPTCGAMFRKALFEEVGLFDEDFFAYGDDTELAIRARMAGWKCLYVPKAVIYHKNSGTAGQYSPFKAFFVERNRFWVTLKYFPLPLLCLTPFFTLYRFALQAYGALTHRGAAGRFTEIYSPWQLMVVLLKAYGWGFIYLPRMWKKRREMMKLRKVTYGEICSWFKRFGIEGGEISLRD